MLSLSQPGGAVSETIVDSIQYFSLKYCPSDNRTVVMMLSSDNEDDSDDESDAIKDEEYSVPDVMNLLHFLHSERHNLPEELFRYV